MMADPLSIQGLQTGLIGPSIRPDQAGPTTTPDGKSFKDVLMDNLSEVNRLQQEAADGIERVATGQTDNLAEVLTAVKKADVAFSMLMEMRNKLVDAYREVQQMRV
jgi:flagellar hook-basal body complex protein FliE